MVVVLADEWPVARKVHRCDVYPCRAPIVPGDRYHRQRNVGDDGPYVWKAHALCDAAYFAAVDSYFDDEAPDPDDVAANVRRFWIGLALVLHGCVDPEWEACGP